MHMFMDVTFMWIYILGKKKISNFIFCLHLCIWHIIVVIITTPCVMPHLGTIIFIQCTEKEMSFSCNFYHWLHWILTTFNAASDQIFVKMTFSSHCEARTVRLTAKCALGNWKESDNAVCWQCFKTHLPIQLPTLKYSERIDLIHLMVYWFNAPCHHEEWYWIFCMDTFSFFLKYLPLVCIVSGEWYEAVSTFKHRLYGSHGRSDVISNTESAKLSHFQTQK